MSISYLHVHMNFIKIQTGKLNTLVNKFMAVSRLCGILYIGVIAIDQMVKAIFDENEVRILLSNVFQKTLIL